MRCMADCSIVGETRQLLFVSFSASPGQGWRGVELQTTGMRTITIVESFENIVEKH